MLDLRGFIIGSDSPNQAPEGAAKSLLGTVADNWVNPEVIRRTESGSWTEGESVRRFQVQFLDDGEAAIRLNDEVGGYLEIESGGRFEMNELLSKDEIGSVLDYRLPDAHAHHPHVTGWMHGRSWFTTHQLAYRDPGRHDDLAAGREFLASAQDALNRGRLRVCFDTAYSAAELLARAELLSCAPAIQFVLRTTTHDGVINAYNAWAGHLGNGDARFAAALNRLAELRRVARYGKPGQLEDQDGEDLLEVLGEMERHVARLAEGPLHDMPDSFKVVAARTLRPGEFAELDATTIFPVKES